MAAMQMRFPARAATTMFARLYCTAYNVPQQVKKSVFISQSTDVFTNLALEDWIYKNYDFTHHHILMLWRNKPCVVIGRHQNPWLEANVGNLHSITECGVELARRNSGGGTVYQDLGNLNLTFFTPRDRYNRKHNLEIISRALFRKYGLKLDISKREDLTIDNHKVSGTAAKLGRTNAYHHCTLLVEVNKVDLHEALCKQKPDLKTSATPSVKSTITNICEENPLIGVEDVISAIGWEYLRVPVDSLKDGGLELANHQKGFHMINPTNQWFAGISEVRNNLSSWDWCYGKTPKFSLTRSFPVPMQFLSTTESFEQNLQITMEVENGRVSDVTLFIPPAMSNFGFSGEAKVVTNLEGRKFTENSLSSLGLSFNSPSGDFIEDKGKFVTECVRQVMTSV